MKKLFAVLLAVLMLGAIALPVFAASSPGGDGKFTIDIYYHLDSVEQEQIEKADGETYDFVPKVPDGYEFDHYDVYTVDENGVQTLVGTYTTLDGITLKFDKEGSKLPELIFGEDVRIDVYYKEKTPVNPDPGPVSPPTGASILPYIALMLVGLLGVAFATRKLVKNH